MQKEKGSLATPFIDQNIFQSDQSRIEANYRWLTGFQVKPSLPAHLPRGR